MLDIVFRHFVWVYAVVTENSLNQSIEKAVKRYSSLFSLPSYTKIILALALVCIGGVSLSTISLNPSFDELLHNFALGFSLFLMNLVCDCLICSVVLRKDKIYDWRRTVALSFFCWVLWLLFLIAGVAVAIPLGQQWWVRLNLLGFSAVLILRLIVFTTTSPAGYGRLLIASVLQPFLCVIPFLVYWIYIGYSVTIYLPLFFVFSISVSFASSFLFLSILNRIGKQTLGVPSLSLLKAFLLNWILDLNDPFEELLEKLSEEQDVEAHLVKFGVHKPMAVVIVPSIHPGPFKNIGSSSLPSMLKTALEKKLGCTACVPHGLFGHELDLASQRQNQKVVDQITQSMDFEASYSTATPLVKVSSGPATASCQIFGSFALLSLTLAPSTTEDLPEELGEFVRLESERLGLACSIVVNAHNSINGATPMPEALDSLRLAAAACLAEASSTHQQPFEVGAATVVPSEYGLRDGMGAGGITVIAVKAGDKKTVYITVDGNNMVSGLREKILSALQSVGISEGEVFTTDTHSVSAVVLSERGYHPVGEVMDHERLIGYVKKATVRALTGLEPSKAACRKASVANVKVIGEERLETLCSLIDRCLRRAKRIVIPIFAGAGLILMLFLLFV
jgi:putative membrane protein